MEFKDRLKLLRNDKYISAVDLANRLNKSESAIRMWESGKTKPDADTLIELSRMLDCSTDFLLGLSDIKNSESEDHIKETMDNILVGIAELPTTDKENLLNRLNDVIFSILALESSVKLQEKYTDCLHSIIKDFRLAFSTLYTENGVNKFKKAIEQQKMPHVNIFYENFKIEALIKITKLWDMIIAESNEIFPFSNKYEDALEILNSTIQNIYEEGDTDATQD